MPVLNYAKKNETLLFHQVDVAEPDEVDLISLFSIFGSTFFFSKKSNQFSPNSLQSELSKHLNIGIKMCWNFQSVSDNLLSINNNIMIVKYLSQTNQIFSGTYFIQKAGN